jgi:hypothetical protein
MNTFPTPEKTMGDPARFRDPPSSLPVQLKDIAGLLTVAMPVSSTEIFSTSILIRLIKALGGMVVLLHSIANQSSSLQVLLLLLTETLTSAKSF